MGDSPMPLQQPLQKPPTSTALSKVSITVTPLAESDDVSDSDSDDGCTAAQVLATRKFKPVNLGGSRPAHKIKASLPPLDAPRFDVDEAVLARFGGGDRWFPATVLEQRKGNTYHLKYDDGEVEYQVPVEFIKLQTTKCEEDEDDE